MEFRELCKHDMHDLVQWRNATMVALRTPFMLTDEMQVDFYDKVVCDRRSNARMWAVWQSGIMVGMAGLMNIEWENGLAEISIILDPDKRGAGLGYKVVEELLRRGFDEMRLENIYGECYACNPAHSFWLNVCKAWSARYTTLPGRKFYNGTYHNSLYFSVNKEDYYGNRGESERH